MRDDVVIRKIFDIPEELKNEYTTNNESIILDPNNINVIYGIGNNDKLFQSIIDDCTVNNLYTFERDQYFYFDNVYSIDPYLESVESEILNNKKKSKEIYKFYKHASLLNPDILLYYKSRLLDLIDNIKNKSDIRVYIILLSNDYTIIEGSNAINGLTLEQNIFFDYDSYMEEIKSNMSLLYDYELN